VLVVSLSSSCSSGRHDPSTTQENFGVRMARMNLWREAMFRFKRAVEMKPEDALAHNNLAVAYEANGDFDNALKEYREAIRLDKSNQYIQKNYSRFVEFTSRNKKRQQRRETTTRTAAASTSGAPDSPVVVPPPSTTSPPPAPPTDTAAPPQPTPNPPGG
jgi:tetratricopeptide (TPR) repeat protein